MIAKIFDGDMFTWRKGAGNSSLSLLGLTEFPTDFRISSQKTGKLLTFVSDEETMINNEFFDGEAAAYVSTEGNVKVQIRVGE